ncbi:rna-directed dna polymerase from mobile element jockey-like [Limosa lapponica baueri]|uniref:Rna-directed dna polymerase from mobile element jockey-like n=1 Tax=Limosa lapponica baueri TaxID=1758121 RepID=A0A2I0TQV8_LIMLA|nr:rna-directed dna polymerase from mobile element jockey-like [Limosa lapponica baueri]
MQDNQVIRPSEHEFIKGRFCLINLISLYDTVICLVDEGKAVDVVYLDGSKAVDTISHSILLEKLAACGFGGPQIQLCVSPVGLSNTCTKQLSPVTCRNLIDSLCPTTMPNPKMSAREGREGREKKETHEFKRN